MNKPLLTEDEIRQTMSDITRRYEGERQKLRDAYEAFGKREARVQLAITFMEPSLLLNHDARGYVERAKTDSVKLTIPDKEAIIMLECETEQVAYDLAKFDVETSDQMYRKLEPQLSYFQSEMKLR